MAVDDSPLLMVVQTQLPKELAGWWLSRGSDWPMVAQLPMQLAQILTNLRLIYGLIGANNQSRGELALTGLAPPLRILQHMAGGRRQYKRDERVVG